MKHNLRQKAKDEGTEATDIKSAGPGATKEKRKRTSKSKTDANLEDPLTSPYFQPVTPPRLPSQEDLPQPQPGERLKRSFYNQDTIELARALLGKVICRKLPGTGQILKGTIVETEAYPGVGDPASHSFKGIPTQSSMAMFMDPGTSYVYFTYGMYYCFNVSSKDNGGACLFRAAELLEDYEIMHTFRQAKKKQSEEKPTKRLKRHELANGPAKLCLAFNIDRSSCDKIDMTTSEDLWLEESLDPKYFQRQFEIQDSKRVGIDSQPVEARNQLCRFFISGNISVSKARFKEVQVESKKKARSKK